MWNLISTAATLCHLASAAASCWWLISTNFVACELMIRCLADAKCARVA